MPPRNAASAALPASAFRLQSGPTVLSFSRVGDRWAHRIAVAAVPPVKAGTQPTTVIWESLEGPDADAADPRWPASPAFTELSVVEPRDRHDPGRAAIVGVGRVGRSHFSASFAFDPGETGTIRIEIACRVHESPGWLGSTYREGRRRVRLAAAGLAPSLPGTITWAYSVGPAGLTAVRNATLEALDEALD